MAAIPWEFNIGYSYVQKKTSNPNFKVSWNNIALFFCNYLLRVLVPLTEFMLVWLCRKLWVHKHTLESVPVLSNELNVKFLAQRHNSFPMTGFEPMQLAILRLLAWCVNCLNMLPQKCCSFIGQKTPPIPLRWKYELCLH